jgi:hypothetical protein
MEGAASGSEPCWPPSGIALAAGEAAGEMVGGASRRAVPAKAGETARKATSQEIVRTEIL